MRSHLLRILTHHLQAYIGSLIAEEDADQELASYAAFTHELPLLVDATNEVIKTRLYLPYGGLPTTFFPSSGMLDQNVVMGNFVL